MPRARSFAQLSSSQDAETTEVASDTEPAKDDSRGGRKNQFHTKIKNQYSIHEKSNLAWWLHDRVEWQQANGKLLTLEDLRTL